MSDDEKIDLQPRKGWDPRRKAATSGLREQYIKMGLIKPAPPGVVPDNAAHDWDLEDKGPKPLRADWSAPMPPREQRRGPR